MKGIIVRQWTTFDKLKIEELSEPKTFPKGVKIKVKAAGVSFATSLFVQGKYQVRPDLPFIPGTEIAGEIMEVGESAKRFKKGQRVCAVIDYGGLAEVAVAKEVNVYEIPDELEFPKAITFTNSYATSLAALSWENLLNIKENDWLLIHGAGGGVGIAAIEIGKILGAKVIATASSEDKLNIASDHGADHIINHKEQNFRDSVLSITSDAGVNAVYDPVGGETFSQSLRCMTPESRIMPVGFACGTVPQIPANILLVKNLTVCGLNMGLYFGWGPRDLRYVYENKMRSHMDQLFSWFKSRLIRPVIHNTYPLDRVTEAMDDVLSRRSIGRIAVVMD